MLEGSASFLIFVAGGNILWKAAWGLCEGEGIRLYDMLGRLHDTTCLKLTDYCQRVPPGFRPNRCWALEVITGCSSRRLGPVVHISRSRRC